MIWLDEAGLVAFRRDSQARQRAVGDRARELEERALAAREPLQAGADPGHRRGAPRRLRRAQFWLALVIAGGLLAALPSSGARAAADRSASWPGSWPPRRRSACSSSSRACDAVLVVGRRSSCWRWSSLGTLCSIDAPLATGPYRAASRAILFERVAGGAWPSGKATGFGPVIPGSNPGAPVNRRESSISSGGRKSTLSRACGA